MAQVINVKKQLNSNYPLYISNKIIEAHFALPISEQRLLYAYISKLTDEHEDFPELELSIKEFTEMIGLADPNYNEVKLRLRSLMDRRIEIETEEEWVTFHWFSIARYKRKEGMLKLRIHDELKPYLLQLKKEFTRLITKQVMQFKSVYSIRIYMLCKQYQAIGKRSIELEELRKKLGIELGKYSRYNDFKRFVLQQAQKEINAVSDIQIEFEEIKKARKVVEILFFIEKNVKVETAIKGAESFTLKSMAELAGMLLTEIKKRWNVDFPVKYLQQYRKDTIVELLMTILRGVYDEQEISYPIAFFKKALDNIEKGKYIY